MTDRFAWPDVMLTRTVVEYSGKERSTVTRAALRQKLGIAALRECTPRRRCGKSCGGFEVVSGCIGSGS